MFRLLLGIVALAACSAPTGSAPNVEERHQEPPPPPIPSSHEEVAGRFVGLQGAMSRIGQLSKSDSEACKQTSRETLPELDAIKVGMEKLPPREELTGCFNTAVGCMMCDGKSEESCRLFGFFAGEASTGNTRRLKAEIDAEMAKN